MELSLMIRGQHPQGEDMRARLADDLALARRAEALGFNAVVKGSHYSADPLQSLQQIPFLAQVAALAPGLRIVAGLVLLPHNALATVARQIEVYRRALDKYGKPFPAELPMRREVFVAPTREEAIRLARPYLEVKYQTYRAWGQDKVMPAVRSA